MKKISSLLLFCSLLASCSFMRKMNKQETKSDSTAAGVYDDSRLLKMIEQINENKRSISTTEKGVQLQPIIIEGKTQYVPTPYERSTVDLTEINQRLSDLSDSVNKKVETSTAVTKNEKAKDVDESAKPNLLAWLGGGAILFFLLFGGGMLAIIKQVKVIKSQIKV